MIQCMCVAYITGGKPLRSVYRISETFNKGPFQDKDI